MKFRALNESYNYEEMSWYDDWEDFPFLEAYQEAMTELGEELLKTTAEGMGVPVPEEEVFWEPSVEGGTGTVVLFPTIDKDEDGEESYRYEYDFEEECYIMENLLLKLCAEKKINKRTGKLKPEYKDEVKKIIKEKMHNICYLLS